MAKKSGANMILNGDFEVGINEWNIETSHHRVVYHCGDAFHGCRYLSFFNIPNGGKKSNENKPKNGEGRIFQDIKVKKLKRGDKFRLILSYKGGNHSAGVKGVVYLGSYKREEGEAKDLLANSRNIETLSTGWDRLQMDLEILDSSHDHIRVEIRVEPSPDAEKPQALDIDYVQLNKID